MIIVDGKVNKHKKVSIILSSLALVLILIYFALYLFDFQIKALQITILVIIVIISGYQIVVGIKDFKNEKRK